MNKSIDNLLNYMEKNRKELTISKVYQYIIDNFKIIYKHDGQEQNRVYYGSSNIKLWFENGFYFEKDQSYDLFGNSKLSGTTLSLGSILSDEADEAMVICEKEVLNKDEQNECEQHFIVDDTQSKEQLITYIKSKQELSKDDVIDYIGSYEGDISCYKILNKELKKDKDIIDSVISKIFKNSSWQYDEIIEYNKISPYGGEDIDYFPNSISHCFMDNVFIQCDNIGLTELLSEKEIQELSYNTMIQNKQIDYLLEKLEFYDEKVKLLKSEEEVFKLLKKYKDLLYILDIYEEEEEYYPYYCYENKRDEIQQKLNIKTAKLKIYEDKEFTWLQKKLLKRQQYKRNIANIILLKDKIEELKDRLNKLRAEAELEPVVRDMDKFNCLPTDIRNKCKYFFKEKGIPKEKKGIKNYFKKVQQFQKENKAEYDHIRKLLN